MVLHFSTLTMNYQKEIKETISFIITSKRIKYLAISLPREVKDLHSQNCKTVMKETEEHTDGKIHLTDGSEKLILLK